MALSLFLIWLLSIWQDVTNPVGRWVILTAESVVFTPWPPHPLDLYTSILKSLSFISTFKFLFISGVTNTDANDVWRLLLLSNGLILTNLWTPVYPFK